MSSRKRRYRKKRRFRLIKVLAVLIVAIVVLGLCAGILKGRKANQAAGRDDSAAAQEFSVDASETGAETGQSDSDEPADGSETEDNLPAEDDSEENERPEDGTEDQSESVSQPEEVSSGKTEEGEDEARDGEDGDPDAEQPQKEEEQQTAEPADNPVQVIEWNSSWKYADYSEIHSDSATLYRAEGSSRKDITVCVNAGHGTKGGTDYETLCHPDGTGKYVGGSTDAGEKYASAVSRGTTLNDGTTEADANLAVALVLKEVLLDSGYDVLMIRENDDTQLDNVARTVMANQYADCHIAIHYNSSDNDKGAFYVSVPDVDAYKNMEPVKTWWREHNALGEALIDGLDGAGIKIWQYRSMGIDLTQTSYSTISSVDLEVGDRASSHGPEKLQRMAEGIRDGVDVYFGF